MCDRSGSTQINYMNGLYTESNDYIANLSLVGGTSGWSYVIMKRNVLQAQLYNIIQKFLTMVIYQFNDIYLQLLILNILYCTNSVVLPDHSFENCVRTILLCIIILNWWWNLTFHYTPAYHHICAAQVPQGHLEKTTGSQLSDGISYIIIAHLVVRQNTPYGTSQLWHPA